MKWSHFFSGNRPLRRAVPRAQRSRLVLETLEERCLLDAGGLGSVASGLREAALVYDIRSQIQALGSPGASNQRTWGYLLSDVGNLIGNTVSSIPGADTKTIGQAITTAGDLGRLAAFVFTNGLKNMDTPAGQAVQDFLVARQDLEQAGVYYSQGSLPQRNQKVSDANTADARAASKINEFPSPSEVLVTQTLNDLYLLNNDSAYYPDPRDFFKLPDPSGGFATMQDRFQHDVKVVEGTLPLSATGLIEALSDVLAVAGDVSALAGGRVGGIVGDALGTAHDALATGIDIAEGQDPTSDLASLGADGLGLINDVLPAPNPTSQSLPVNVKLQPNGSSPLASVTNFVGTIATFQDPNVSNNQTRPPASAYTAYIFWGDGSSSFGQIALGTGGHANYTVTGTHFYSSPTDQPVSVVIAGNGAQGQGAETVILNPSTGGTPAAAQGITVAGQTLVTQGSLAVSGSVATVHAPAAGTYTATIDWGDGTSSTGQVVAQGNDTFTVTVSHTYAQPGGYLTNVQVSDTRGNLASAFGTVNLGPSPVSPPPAGGPSSGGHSPSGGPPAASPPGSPPVTEPTPNNPLLLALREAEQISQMLFASFDQIVAQIQSEVQQLLNAELALERGALTALTAQGRITPITA
jgi:hypothetical protein